MKQPEGFVEPGYEDYTDKLMHTIYDTMQGGHDWFETLDTTYNELEYITSHTDPCVRYKKEEENYTLTVTYTDDVFGALNDDDEIERRKDEIAKVWEIRDVGETVFPGNVSPTRPSIGNHLTLSAPLLGACAKSISPREYCTKKCAFTCRNHPRQQHVP